MEPIDLRWKESPRELFKMALGVLNKGFNIDTEMVKRKPELKPIREREILPGRLKRGNALR